MQVEAARNAMHEDANECICPPPPVKMVHVTHICPWIDTIKGN